MPARQHSRFIHFALPWLIAAAGLAVFWITLHPWVSLESVPIVGKIAGWDWSTYRLPPVTLLLTLPLRGLPDAWLPTALNLLAALLAAGTLGLFAKCVALLPHDRTRDQRQRERSDFSFLSVPIAWVPPVAAAILLGAQLTFWEHATAFTGEMVNLFLFAFCIYCFLRFRVLQEDRYLAWLSFAFGAGVANDWGLIAFCPLFVAAIVWAKGIAFFDGRFLTRTTAAGLAGLLLYLVEPIALKVSGQADASLFEILRTSLSIQRNLILAFPRWILLFCCVTSIVPIVFIGIRWPSTFGDLSAAGTALTNFFFRLIHATFLVFCAWVMFDPPFSPRALGTGLPVAFLRFYLLTALAIGYLVGYVILIFAQEPDRKLKRASDGMQALNQMVGGFAALAALAAAAGLVFHNLPAIRGQNGPLTRELAESLLPPAEPDGRSQAILSDDPTLLLLATGLSRQSPRPTPPIFLSTDASRWQVYHRRLEQTLGDRWPALVLEELSDPLPDIALLRQLVVLSQVHRIYYLHPSFGYYFEPFHQVPAGTVFVLDPQPTNTYVLPRLPDDSFEATHAAWTRIRERLVDEPLIARLKRHRVTDAARVASHWSRAFNTWGVTLQETGQLQEAARFFAAAIELSEDNTAALINAAYNEQLREGKRDALILDKDVSAQLDRFRGDIGLFLRVCGPVDEPSFRFRQGRTFSDGNLHRQAARQFARAATLQPGNIETRLWLASATLQCGLYDEVLRIVAGIRTQFSDIHSAHATDLASLEAWARFHQGDLPEAERILLEAQSRFPERLDALRTLNDIYISANMTNAALAAAERLVAATPGDPRPLITKSAIQMHIGALPEAIQTLDRALEIQPGFFPALVNRALANSRLQRLDDAEADYRRLLELAPRMNAIFYHLGEIDFQRGNATSARRHYRQFLENAIPGSPEARTAQDRLNDIAAGRLPNG
ncbi:MAG: hypothetical protein KF833_08535 [Verrucomicrobiae bacterium]|nr:hypothetical protein [Verrucomicrobiae bacterium]